MVVVWGVQKLAKKDLFPLRPLLGYKGMTTKPFGRLSC